MMQVSGQAVVPLHGSSARFAGKPSPEQLATYRQNYREGLEVADQLMGPEKDQTQLYQIIGAQEMLWGVLPHVRHLPEATTDKKPEKGLMLEQKEELLLGLSTLLKAQIAKQATPLLERYAAVQRSLGDFYTREIASGEKGEAMPREAGEAFLKAGATFEVLGNGKSALKAYHNASRQLTAAKGRFDAMEPTDQWTGAETQAVQKQQALLNGMVEATKKHHELVEGRDFAFLKPFNVLA